MLKDASLKWGRQSYKMLDRAMPGKNQTMPFLVSDKLDW